jgi:hypothetical protein
LTDFVCLYNYEFGLSLFKIVRSSVIFLLSLFQQYFTYIVPVSFTGGGNRSTRKTPRHAANH